MTTQNTLGWHLALARRSARRTVSPSTPQPCSSASGYGTATAPANPTAARWSGGPGTGTSTPVGCAAASSTTSDTTNWGGDGDEPGVIWYGLPPSPPKPPVTGDGGSPGGCWRCRCRGRRCGGGRGRRRRDARGNGRPWSGPPGPGAGGCSPLGTGTGALPSIPNPAGAESPDDTPPSLDSLTSKGKPHGAGMGHPTVLGTPQDLRGAPYGTGHPIAHAGTLQALGGAPYKPCQPPMLGTPRDPPVSTPISHTKANTKLPVRWRGAPHTEAAGHPESRAGSYQCCRHPSPVGCSVPGAGQPQAWRGCPKARGRHKRPQPGGTGRGDEPGHPRGPKLFGDTHTHTTWWQAGGDHRHR